MTGSHASHLEGGVLESVADAPAVLLLASDEWEDAGCRELLAASGDRSAHAVGVTYEPGEAFYRRFGARTDDRVSRTVIAVGDGADAPAGVELVSVAGGRTVPARVRRRIDGFGDDPGVVCFDRLSPLVDDIGLTRTFRFLNGLVSTLRERDGSAYVHADPNANDRRTLDAVTTVFDAVVRADGGAWDLVWRRNTE